MNILKRDSTPALVAIVVEFETLAVRFGSVRTILKSKGLVIDDLVMT